MRKYRYFLLLFSAAIAVLFWIYFPICFENNDDQTMLAINSGMLTGAAAPFSFFSNIIIGKWIDYSFHLLPTFNWYSFYLEIILLLVFMVLCTYVLLIHKIALLKAFLFILILFFGFFSWAIITPQFTTIALFCSITSLFLYTLPIRARFRFTAIVALMTIAVLIRGDAYYIFALFSITLLYRFRKSPLFRRLYWASILAVSLVFITTQAINRQVRIYKHQHTFYNTEAIDIIAARPIKIEEDVLAQHHFSTSDIQLIQSWMVVDDAYLTGKKIKDIALQLKSTRNGDEVIAEIKKIIADERYLLLMYIITITAIVWISRKLLLVSAINAFLAVGLFGYLIVAYRLPHRITFPILSYLILSNLFLVIKSEAKPILKMSFLSVLLLLSGYKFYCVLQMVPLHTARQQNYTSCINEINTHPKDLFIGVDAFPLESMDAKASPANLISAHNLFLTGWYACMPDYQTMLERHRLKNLTSDLQHKDNVYFITENKAMLQAYIEVMKQRHHLQCHFEPATEFKALKALKLIIEN